MTPSYSDLSATQTDIIMSSTLHTMRCLVLQTLAFDPTTATSDNTRPSLGESQRETVSSTILFSVILPTFTSPRLFKLCKFYLRTELVIVLVVCMLILLSRWRSSELSRLDTIACQYKSSFRLKGRRNK